MSALVILFIVCILLSWDTIMKELYEELKKEYGDEEDLETDTDHFDYY